jgi:hypothetical protein
LQKDSGFPAGKDFPAGNPLFLAKDIAREISTREGAETG